MGSRTFDGPTDASCIFGYIYAQAEDQKRRYGVAGHSFFSVVDFSLPEIKVHSERTFRPGEGKP